jgi:uncharacterized protein YndB with AHSA1/START domain
VCLLERSTNSLFTFGGTVKTLGISLWLALASVAFGQTTSAAVKAAASDRALVLAITIPASQAAVWQAFSTSEGLSTWLTPDAVVDLRPGGEWTAHYPGGKTGGGTIISFIPQKELVLSALAPEHFPTVRAQRTTARFRFIPQGEATVVQLEQTGWKNGEEWDKAYEYLFAGNAQLLATLHRRFVNGPLDWAKEWGNAKK